MQEPNSSSTEGARYIGGSLRDLYCASAEPECITNAQNQEQHLPNNQAEIPGTCCTRWSTQQSCLVLKLLQTAFHTKGVDQGPCIVMSTPFFLLNFVALPIHVGRGVSNGLGTYVQVRAPHRLCTLTHCGRHQSFAKVKTSEGLESVSSHSTSHSTQTWLQ